jgi:hypothetical protein
VARGTKRRFLCSHATDLTITGPLSVALPRPGAAYRRGHPRPRGSLAHQMGRGRLHQGTRAGIAAAALACLLLLASSASAIAIRDFENPASNDPQQQFTPGNVQRADTPNDPEYDRAEPDDQDGPPSTTNLYDERFDLFGFPSALTQASAVYKEGPSTGKPMISGFNAAGAWKLDRGNPGVTIAVLDTGIKWDREGLRLQVHLNRGELPTPMDGANPCPYDCNGDGVFNVADYANDPRVSHTAGPHGSPQIDAEDLIATFSDGTDADGNGFVDDIAGWDFFDNDNDPYDASSYFAAANHGSGRAHEAVERGNDGQGALGVCPHCQLLPIRTWDTFVSDGNTFAMGILYATDNGVKVIEGANGSTYHSAFAEQASNYAYEHGVVQTFSGDDLNTGNHNYPANYGHAMLIQGTVPDTVGFGTDAGTQFAEGRAGLCSAFNPPAPPVGCPGSNAPVQTYFRGANTTQYGGKSSIAMEGSTGSENTGKSSGAAALVVSAALDRPGGAITLRPDETRAILEQTAERVTSGNTVGSGAPDPAAPASAPPEDQWSPHFGWGRVNLGAAVAVARSGAIPPEAAIDAPDWYAPVTGSSMHVTGLARARFADGGHLHWKLQWGTGQEPASWNTVGEGDSSGEVTDFGSVDLGQVRAALASFNPPPDTGGPTLSAVSPNPYRYEFTVRLIVTGQGIGTAGIDRRVFTSAQDSSLRNGFPRRMGTGGEAPIRYGDINGDNVQELLVPTEDGSIHAYEPDGSELPGWPVHTLTERQAANHTSAPGFAALTSAGSPPREPPRGPVIGDLDGDGRPEVIDTAGTHIYAWEPNGSLRPGFPVSSDLSQCTPDKQSQPLHHPKCGFLASPAVADLRGNGRGDIVAPGLDGLLYGFDGNGHALPHFPVRLVDPSVPPDQQMIAESINEPAIGDLNGDGRDDIVVATNETYGATPPSSQTISGLYGEAFSNALANAAGGSSRVYAVNGASGQFLPGWPIKLNGAIQSTLPLIGPGQNPAIAKIGGQTRVVASTTGSATIGIYDTAGNQVRAVQQGAYGPGSDATDRSGTINLFESASIGDLTGSGALDVVKYGLSLSDVTNLLLTGQNTPYNHLIGAYDAQSGAPLPAFPRVTDDFQFLSSSDIAKVHPGQANQVLAGTGLGLLHAYDGITGLDAAGFPKVTGGWLFAPAALSDDGRMADITREGFLFQWNLPDLPKCQGQWPSFRHDQQQSGNYDRDGTQPYRPTGLHLDGAALAFTAPGDDYGCGTADHYQVATAGHRITPTNFADARRLGDEPQPRPSGTEQRYAVPPSHDRFVAIRAVDEAGNVGWVANFDYGRAGGPCKNPIRGNGKGNRLLGTARGDRISGRGGRDRILGRAGDDCLAGGRGRDVIKGGRGRDKIKGNGGADKLSGGRGPDRLSGGRGRDRLLVRGGGRDLASCGPGHDVAIVDRGDHVRGCEVVRRR